MHRSIGSRKRVLAVGVGSLVAVVAVAMLVLSPAAGRGSRTNTQVTWERQPATVSPVARQQVQATYAALPLAFEPNEGQFDSRVKYMARAHGYTMFLTQDEAVFSFTAPSSEVLPSTGRSRGLISPRQPVSEKAPAGAVRMRMAGGNSDAQLTSSDPLPGKVNYFRGNDPKNWHTGIPQLARVSYKAVYPGIDLTYYGEQSKLEFDFIVTPQVDPAHIALAFTGARHIATDASGNLIIASGARDLVLHKPVAYQEMNGVRHSVNAQFAMKAGNQIGFELGSYDRNRELVIDPSVTYATYLGGSKEDDGNGIAVDSSGNAYITGQTKSTDLPSGGTATNANAGGFDAFVTKINSNGSLGYTTFIGGTGDDSGNAIAVDGSGNAFVAGGTGSADFPASGGFQTSFGGGLLDAFAFQLNASGALAHSTYLGGNGDDVATGVAIDGTGVYVVGSTGSTNFPTQAAFQGNIVGQVNGFVTKLNISVSALSYSTYLGAGTGDFASAVAVHNSQAYVTGATQNAGFPTTASAFQKTCSSCASGLSDAFVTVFDSLGSESSGFIYSTLLGGKDQDQGLGIAVDSSGDAYVTGLTSSSDFPLLSAWQQTFGGSQNAFVTKVNAAGSALDYSTFLGGSNSDAGASIAVDSQGNAYVTGQASSNDFPLSTPTQLSLGGGNDGFVSQLTPSGLLVFSTFLGGSKNEDTNAASANLAPVGGIAVSSNGANLFVTGNTASTDFPTVSPEQPAEAGDIDAFAVKYALPTGPDFAISATTPAPVSPGGSASSTVDLISLNGYNAAVTLTCSVSGGSSPAPTCSASSAFSTNPVTPSATGATATLMIATSAAKASVSRKSNIFYATWLPIAGFSFLGLAFGSAGSRRKRLLNCLAVSMMMVALFLMPACSSSSSSTTVITCNGCTSAGTYKVLITGTAGSTTHSTQVLLTVD